MSDGEDVWPEGLAAWWIPDVKRGVGANLEGEPGEAKEGGVQRNGCADRRQGSRGS